MKEESIYKNYSGPSEDLPLEMSTIERCGAEVEVMEMLAKGHDWRDVLKWLRSTYPNQTFTKRDLDLFVARNHKIAGAVAKEDRQLAKRHADANIRFKESLLDMQEQVLQQMKNASEERNFSGLASLHNSILQNIKLFSQLSGELGGDGDVNISVGRDLAAAIEDKNKNIRAVLLETSDPTVKPDGKA